VVMAMATPHGITATVLTTATVTMAPAATTARASQSV
jgi:hypothetical protein